MYWYLCHILLVDEVKLKNMYVLTFMLLKPRVISLCHQFKARPASTSVGFILLADLQLLSFISLKLIMESSKNGRWSIPFKKFSRVKRRDHLHIIVLTQLNKTKKKKLKHCFLYDFRFVCKHDPPWRVTRVCFKHSMISSDRKGYLAYGG